MTHRRWLGAAVLVGLIALGVLVGLVWSGDSDDSGVDTPSEARPSEPEVVVTHWLDQPEEDREGELDRALLAEAARGEHGLELRNRVCRLCVGRVLQERACRGCEDLAEAARLEYDVVDEEGRPYPAPLRVSVSCAVPQPDRTFKTVSPSIWSESSSGFVHVPAGECGVRVKRMDGLSFPVQAEASFTAEVGKTVYRLLEMDGRRIGGIGVKVDRQRIDGGPREGWVVIDHIGDAAKGRIPLGAEIVAVDGERMAPTSIQPHLAGPVGTQVEVQIRYETRSGWVEEAVLLERGVIEPHQVGLGGTPG